MNTKETAVELKRLEDFNGEEHWYKFTCIKCGKIDIKCKASIKNMHELICGPCLRKETTLKNHGSTTWNNPEKSKQTCLEKYGVTNAFNKKEAKEKNKEVRLLHKEEIKEKTKQTNLLKYGVENPAQIQEVKEKIQKTNLLRYGTKAPAQNEKIKQKERNTLYKKYGNDPSLWPGAIASKKKFIEYRKTFLNSELEWLNENDFIGKYSLKTGTVQYRFKCKVCGTEFQDDFHNGWPICRKCHHITTKSSIAEKEIVDYIKSIYAGNIIENDRTIVGNQRELDIYLPELKLAIEYNGSWWHSFNRSNLSFNDFKRKSEQKRLICQEKGIRLITIDECDYLDRPEVFKRFLLDTIVPRKKLYARNCEYKNVPLNEAKQFCETYHVNGFRPGSIKVGLYDKNDLVCLAVFGKYKDSYECIRLCYKSGIDIIGGWEKIQKNFGHKFLHYVNLKYFMGENKTGVGFRFMLPNGKALHRNTLQKNTGLYKYCKKIDPSLSDFDNCIQSGLLCITDLGNDIRWYNLSPSA